MNLAILYTNPALTQMDQAGAFPGPEGSVVAQPPGIPSGPSGIVKTTGMPLLCSDSRMS